MENHTNKHNPKRMEKTIQIHLKRIDESAQEFCTNLSQQRTVKLYEFLKLQLLQQQQQPQQQQTAITSTAIEPAVNNQLLLQQPQQQQQQPAFQLTAIQQEINDQVWQLLQLLQQQLQPQQQQ